MQEVDQPGSDVQWAMLGTHDLSAFYYEEQKHGNSVHDLRFT